MASQTSDPGATGQDPIGFEVERVARTDAGRLEVHGRWYGVRGRRFVRPALTQQTGDGERRWLAELEHKPWAAEDGEQWMAAFVLDSALEEGVELELSVAPDITVKLSDGRRSSSPPRRKRSSAAILRAPRVRSDAEPGGPTLSERHQEIQRLNSRLVRLGQELERERDQRARATAELERERSLRASDEDELERERLRRDATLEELEKERSEALSLRSQVGQLQAELELARAARVDADTSAADLATASAELENASTELENTSAELENARCELSKERAQSERLRAQLARERAPKAAPETQEFRAFTAEAEAGSPATLSEPAQVPPPTPANSERTARSGRGQAPPREASRSPASRSEPARRDPGAAAHRSHPAPRPERPLNPALRSHTSWSVRLLALLVILVVIAAVILVIRTTVKP